MQNKMYNIEIVLKKYIFSIKEVSIIQYFFDENRNKVIGLSMQNSSNMKSSPYLQFYTKIQITILSIRLLKIFLNFNANKCQYLDFKHIFNDRKN